ncbi:LysR family transcriptional regulator [Trinickia mobilis]|uniref:LysR family transcriptional regulator n=1 Tax=Trinickia mobilis TaxID=2816356 RepID=UPI001A8CBEDE|nr:LysR family transcriptional regulator [Trinickia mobilis]
MRTLLTTVDWRALQVFVTVCDTASMTEAARVLGVTQSAVSQLIKSLEREQGGLLFDRDIRPLRPTAAGRVLLEQAGGLLEHAHAVTQNVRAAAKAGATQLRIGCVDSFAATVGPELVKSLADRVQDLEMWSGLTPAVSEQLVNRELDIAVCTEATLDSKRVTQRTLFSEPFVAVLPRAFSLAHPQLAFQEALKLLPLIRYTSRSVIAQQVERFVRHLKIEAPRKFEFDTSDPLLSLVASGLGCTITTPLCLWQSRQYLDNVVVSPLPTSRLGQRYFFLLTRNSEWAELADTLANVSVDTVHNLIEPALREALPSLPKNVFN